MEAVKLFNCQTDHAEPDWRRFAVLVLAGCRTEGVATVADAAARDAEFFTVYGRTPDGLSEAITDINPHSGRNVVAILAELCRRSRLALVIDTRL